MLPTPRHDTAASSPRPLLEDSAISLAARIRSGEVAAREVVEAHIAEVERVNPRINAVVATRFDAARAEADAADALLRSGAPAPPLLGVPCTIKESFALAGMPNTAGLVARRGRLAERSATAVARLRGAGAIPLGVTNTSELCMWMETSNRVYGRTNNPYDARRTAGGSSGGEGAIVGAGGVPFGLGADIGGSIRMPAFFCGVFGHKPSGGLVPGTGQYPLAEGRALRFLSSGPLARRAEDLAPILRLLAGPDGEDPACRAMEIGDPAAVRLADLTVLDVVSDGRTRVSPALEAAQERTAATLRRLGATVKRASFAHLRHAFDIWSAGMADAATRSFSSLLGEGEEIRAGRELLRWAARRSPHTLPAIALALLEKVPKLLPSRSRRFLHLGHELKRELEAAIGPGGVMLYPPFPTVAPRHHAALWPPFQWVYTAVLNVMEFAVTAVPLGLDPRGVPLGVQVAAVPGGDHLTIAVAQALEAELGGWVRPSQ